MTLLNRNQQGTTTRKIGSRLGLALVILIASLLASSSVAFAMPVPNHIFRDLPGLNSLERQGTTIHNAGDVDNDGIDDVIVGLRTAAANDPGNHISARVYSGKTGNVLHTINAVPYQHFPSFNPVASVGDVNDDGHAEYMVGTPGAMPNGGKLRVGIVRIFDGKTGNLLHTLNMPGLLTDARFGSSLAVAGDADGDGTVDLIVGAPGFNIENAYLFSGRYTGNPSTNFPLLATLDGPEGSRFGASVGRVGHIIDKDPREAFIVGAPYHPLPNNVGRAYVYMIRPNRAGKTDVEEIFTVDGDNNNDLFGADVDGNLDLNGDNVPDFMVSALGTEPFGPEGMGYVRTFSGADATPLNTIVSDQTGDLFGFSAALLPACEGSPAVVVGAPNWTNADNNVVGRALIYNAATGAQHTQIEGKVAYEIMGLAVAGYVDMNDDGHVEFLAGAPGISAIPTLQANGAGLVLSCVPLPEPDIIAAPNPADFGDVLVGDQQQIVVGIQNQGSADLSLGNLAFTPNSNAAFSLINPPGPQTIPPGEIISLTLQYQPAAQGVQGATLQIPSNDSDHPTNDVILVGKGILRQIQVTPGAVNFGNVDVGETVWANIVIKSVGNVPLTVSNIALQGNGGYSLDQAPQLPQTLLPGHELDFHVLLTPDSVGAYNGTITIANDDPATPSVQVPLAANGVTPNIGPTAHITMEVPYNGNEIHFHGDGSFDPDGSIASYAWDFGHDGETSNQMNPVHTFPCAGGKPCRYVVRLTVTDNGGKSDPTSISALAFIRDVRSRFYGTIQQGGQNVRDGTVIEAYIDDKLVAESLSQTHLGQSVFAIEIRPDFGNTGDGGRDGDTVVFKYRNATANETGIWYSRTDQELNLSAPFFIPPLKPWCFEITKLNVRPCGEPELVPLDGLYVELEEWPTPPIPDPGPLKLVGQAFRLDFMDAGSGEEVDSFAQDYTIETGYTDAQLTEAGVEDETSLQLHFQQNGQWTPAGVDTVDVANNVVTTALNHASVFALFGEPVDEPSEHAIYLPVIAP